MRSVTLYFNPTLFRKNFARFWPIWSLYGLIWLILLPLGILTAGAEGWTLARARELPLNYLGSGAASAALLLAVLFGILAAMAVFSYLYSSRSVGMLHSLPLRRESLFLTNYLSGLCFFLLPNLAVFLLALAAEVSCGALVFSSLFTWLVVSSLYCLFFYSFAVFCAMFTGHILALPAFYFILNVLAAGLAALFSQMAYELLFGYGSGSTPLSEVADWLSPIFLFSRVTGVAYDDSGPVRELADTAHFIGLGYVALYGLIGLVLAALALAVYRRRQLESAGDVVSVGWVRPIFKYGTAFCTAVAVGIFFYSTLERLIPRGAWFLLACMLVCGAAGYFIAEMLLRKSFWVFRHSFKGCVVFLVCLTAAMCTMEFDIIGYEDKVPSAAEVKEVYLSGVETAPYDWANYASYVLNTPEELEQLNQLHQCIVQHKAELEQASWQPGSDWAEDSDGLDVQIRNFVDVHISYTLQDDTVLDRKYTIEVTEELLSQPDSPAARLEALLNRPSLTEESYFKNWREESRLIDAGVLNLYDRQTGEYDTVYLPSACLPELLEAVRTDLANGTLGRRYLLENRERLENCYYSDLELTYSIPAYPQSNRSDEEYTDRITITLQSGASNTLAVLTANGIDPAHLFTQAEMQQLD